MYVCLCFGIKEKELKDLVSAGYKTVQELQKRCKAGLNCGACLEELHEITEEKPQEDLNLRT